MKTQCTTGDYDRALAPIGPGLHRGRRLEVRRGADYTLAMGEPNTSGGRSAHAIPPESVAALQELAQAFLTLEQACSFYPEGHQSRRAPLERLLELLRVEAHESGESSLGVAGESLLWRGLTHDEPTPVLRKFAALLGAQGIASLSWTPGLTSAELQHFVNLLARGNSIGQRTAWDDALRFEHLRVESPDYRSLMTEPAPQGEAGQRRNILHDLLQRILAGPSTEPLAPELELLRESLTDPAAAAALLTEELAGGGRTGTPRDSCSIGKIRRLAAQVERAAQGGAGATRDSGAASLAAVGRHLLPELRLQLLESAMDDAEGGLFTRAFGSLSPGEGVSLLGRNFAMDPAQIERLTRVFQHLIPRRLERMELVPLLREEVRRAGDQDHPLAENAWEEVQELLTGEAGEFTSAAYREQLRRLAAREAARRGGEVALAELPELATTLLPACIADESLRIQFEQLWLATSVERYRDALDGLAGLCATALAAGDRERGLLILKRLLELRGSEETLAGPRSEIERAARAIVGPVVIRALLPPGPAASDEDSEAARALLALAADVSGPVLLDEIEAELDPGRRLEIAALLRGIGSGAVPEVLRRLAGASELMVRTLLPLVAEARDPTAVPALLGLLRRDDPKLRRDVLRALLAIDTAEVRRALPGLLDDHDEEIVQAAAIHLGAAGSPETVRGLLRVFGGGRLSGRRSEQVRRAIFVLGRMRAVEAVAPLGELLLRHTWINRRSQEELGTAAAQGLARIGGEAARTALERGAARAPEKVAAACRRLLARWVVGA